MKMPLLLTSKKDLSTSVMPITYHITTHDKWLEFRYIYFFLEIGYFHRFSKLLFHLQYDQPKKSFVIVVANLVCLCCNLELGKTYFFLYFAKPIGKDLFLRQLWQQNHTNNHYFCEWWYILEFVLWWNRAFRWAFKWHNSE